MNPIAWKTTKGALAFCNPKFGKEQGWTPIYTTEQAKTETSVEIKKVQL